MCREGETRGERGVFASAFIRAGELIAIWGGEELSREELEHLPASSKRYSLQVDEDTYLVSVHEVHEADLINHSCDPNSGLCGPRTLFAFRDIEEGEEICYDYAMSDGSVYDEFTCSCGSAKCRGEIRGSDWLRWDLRLRYGQMFSPYLLRRMEMLEIAEPFAHEVQPISVASFL